MFHLEEEKKEKEEKKKRKKKKRRRRREKKKEEKEEEEEKEKEEKKEDEEEEEETVKKEKEKKNRKSLIQFNLLIRLKRWSHLERGGDGGGTGEGGLVRGLDEECRFHVDAFNGQGSSPHTFPLHPSHHARVPSAVRPPKICCGGC